MLIIAIAITIAKIE